MRDEDLTVSYSADLRYHGQGFEIPIPIYLDAFADEGGPAAPAARLMPSTSGCSPSSSTTSTSWSQPAQRSAARAPGSGRFGLKEGGRDPLPALRHTDSIYIGGERQEAAIYERHLLKAGNVVVGPAVITEMDSTTLVLPGHTATVHRHGSLLIRPIETPATASTGD